EGFNIFNGRTGARGFIYCLHVCLSGSLLNQHSMDLTWFVILIWLLSLLVTAYVSPLIKDLRKARLSAWMIAIGTAVFSSIISSHQPPLIRMVIIVVLQLVSMKILVAIESYSGEQRLTPMQWASFTLGWFGMRPAPFEKLRSSSLPSARILWKGI